MTVALFLYQEIFCRWQAPGECIIYDRGEFCNNIVETLKENFKVETRVISAGRPQANGQVEIYVGQVKAKMRALMSEHGDELPPNWDQSILHHALQIVRSDPSCATGFAPAELLLGRPLVYPLELKKRDVDFSGKTRTQPIFVEGQNLRNPWWMPCEAFTTIPSEKLPRKLPNFKKNTRRHMISDTGRRTRSTSSFAKE